MTYYSYSRLATFEDCPLKYKFNYLDRIKREEEKHRSLPGFSFSRNYGEIVSRPPVSGVFSGRIARTIMRSSGRKLSSPYFSG